ncbi:Coatomer beta subunit [Trema orientale]|uniref:Coatomer beta subunit n=1 Tax=Trema orientale TaxID=63057 RepID=A0A2P5EQ76_TREOI|nr:Coatomer beta subunit [Trema orientale]
MVMESPVRVVESGRGTKWPSSEDAATFGSPLKGMAAEELGLFMKENSLHRHRADSAPNRSDSAPPSMEGSFAAIRSILEENNFSMNSSLDDFRNTLENFESEEQMRSDPAYLACYFSNMNLNVRLPPPIISKENRHLLHHIGNSRRNWKSTSIDDSCNRSPSIHKEVIEEDCSSTPASDDVAENGAAAVLGMKRVSSASRHKSLVDLIQEDFPRTPSPVYNQSRSSSHATTDEPVDYDVHATSSNISSLNKIQEPSSGSIGSPEINSLDSHATKLTPTNVPLSTSLPSSLHSDETGNPQGDVSSDKYVNLDDSASTGGPFRLDTSTIESRTNLKAKSNQEEQQSYIKNVPKLPLSRQHGSSYQVFPGRRVSQGMNNLERYIEKVPHGHPSFSVEVQPSLHSPGFTPAYMASGNPFYTNLHQSSLYATQYSLTGYGLGSTFLPPLMAGYSSHGGFPVPFGATSSPSFIGQAAGLPTGEGIPHVGDVHHPSEFYGQHGSIQQPSFVNPPHMQYYPHAAHEIYGSSVQHGQLASRGIIGSPFTQQESSFSAYMGDQKFQFPTNGNISISAPRKMEFSGNGNSPFMGVMTQFPASPLASPIMPSSPVGGVNHLGRHTEMRFPQGSIGNPGIYPAWQGKRGFNSADDQKKLSFLEELKSSNSPKFGLSDIEGRIVDVDQHGSRFIQQKLEHCTAEEKVSVFKEVVPHASKLITDVFGNYVIQKALDVIELGQKTILVQELDGHVMTCVRDQNGNHVIQKCIECVPAEKIGFIISAFHGLVATLATHPYGCRVIQRVLEHCSDDLQCQRIINEILESASILAQDQYGNYVTQHLLLKGKPSERSQIISKLAGRVVQMSMHKYASNVVEKCLEHGNTAERELLIEEILGESEENDNLLTMMKDQFANYVVQKIFEKSNNRQREILLNHTTVHLDALRKYTYGKHIVARFEQLRGAESQTSEPEGA